VMSVVAMWCLQLAQFPYAATGLAEMPQHMVLHAPYTPFTANGTLNVTAANVEALAAQAASFGATTLWVPGSMGQFDTMTVDERKALVEAWVPAAKRHGLYLIAHVGSGSLGVAAELALHAAQAGAPAIGALPPFYESTIDVAAIAAFLGAVGKAAPHLPLFYYHIPSHTRADISVTDLFDLAATMAPTLAGVKYVGSDQSDWFHLVQKYNTTRALLFAPEPKLSSFVLGLGRGTVLAEDFFAPTYLRMHQNFLRHNFAGARAEQAFKLAAFGVISKYGGAAAERALYRKFPLTKGFDFGPGRLPQQAFDEANWAPLEAGLDALGFWKTLAPPTE